MIKIKAVVIASIGIAIATPAAAQVDHDMQLGSKIPVRPAKADPILDGQIRDRYVSCAYGPHRDKIDPYLLNSDPVTADPDKFGINMRQMTSRHDLRNCFEVIGDQVQGSITYSDTAFRYMMLEAAYLRAYDKLPADHETRVAPLRNYSSKGERLALARSLATLSDCMVAHDPVNADRLLRTFSGTEEEKEAAMAMVPALGACIVEGQDLKITAANIRSFAADGMWQRFVAPNPGAAE